MAISYIGSTGWGNSTQATLAYPAGINAGDLLLCGIGVKPETTTVTAPSGYTSIGSVTGGTGSLGIDTGITQTAIFYKVADGTESGTNASIPGTTGMDTGLWTVAVFRGSGGWSLAGAGGGDSTSDTTFSVTAASDPGVTSTDWVWVFCTIAGNNANFFGALNYSQTGMTPVGSSTNSPGNGTTSVGTDLATTARYVIFSAGTSSGVPTVTSTLNAAQAGSAYLVRIREGAGDSGVALAGTAAGTSTASGNLTVSNTPVALAGSAAGTSSASASLSVETLNLGLTPQAISPFVVAEWETNELSNGGHVGLKGTVSPLAVTSNPDIFEEGAEWKTVIQESGETLWYGLLKEPATNGNVVDLSVDGPAVYKAQREIDRLFYQSIGTVDWVTADSEPHEYSNNKNIQLDVRKSSILWIPDKDHAFAGTEKATAVCWINGDQINRVAFQIKKSDDDANWELALFGANVDDDGLGATLNEITAGDPPWILGAGNPDGTDVDYTISGNYDLIGIALRCNTANTPGRKKFWINNIKVNGRAPDDDFTTSDIVRDICGMVGVDDRYVKESGVPALPRDFQDTSFDEVLTQMAVETGYVWLFYTEGNEEVCYFGPPGRNRWILQDAEMPRDLLPEQRWSGARVRCPSRDGATWREQEAIAEHPERPIKWMTFTLENPMPDETLQDIADRLAEFGNTRRFSGTATFTRIQDDSGRWWHAHYVNAGDEIFIPEKGVWLTVDHLQRRHDRVTVTFPTGVPMLERLNERRARRLAARGRL